MNAKMFFAAAGAALIATQSHAKVSAGTPFADNMVLQRDRPVPVWGTAAPGERVEVSFAGRTKSAVAGADGAWRVTLDPMPASKENRTLKISGPSNTEEIANVLVGEVWFASGQSNMECPIWGKSPRYRDGEGAMALNLARRPFIRYAKNARNPSIAPRYGWKAEWHDFSPASFKATFNNNLSAVAFYFALELYGALEIPVGIIDSSWGGTRVETWIPASTYPFPYKLARRKGHPTQPTVLWNGMVAAWTPFAIRGFIWYQGCSNAGEAGKYTRLMHALYDGWAKEFENPGLKLYFVQLAPFSTDWFRLQMAQSRFAAEEKNAALITTCDHGNLHDIHPNGKGIIGKRLAMLALKRDYGFDEIVADAPALKSWKTEGRKFILSFDNASAWYYYNDDRSKPAGFEIAGPDGKFVPAQLANKSDAAGTVTGKELTVFAKGVSKPRRLRYLARRPWKGSLYSFDSSLPLGPFEIDARVPDEARRAGNHAFGEAFKTPALEGFRKIIETEIPAEAPLTRACRKLDTTATAGAFSRVAYVLELERKDGTVDWAAVAMDAFATDAAALGAPSLSGTNFHQKVRNMSVRSNIASVPEGDFPEGGAIEFFRTNYGQKTALDGIGGNPNTYDFNDRPTPPPDKDGYGCMQVHNAAAKTTIFAFNRFAGPADIGIGNCTDGENPDWTFQENAAQYKSRRLTVLVK